MTLKACLALALLATMSGQAIAQDNGQSGSNDPAANTMLYAPLVYDNHGSSHATARKTTTADNLYALDAGDQWLQEAMENSDHAQSVRQRAMIDNPQLVAYNTNRLPAAPPEGVINADPRQGLLTIAPQQVVVEDVTPPDAPPLPVHHWLHVFNGSLQFTQAYISGNWYQGGENNLALLGTLNWNCNLNQDLHPNWLFNNALSS